VHRDGRVDNINRLTKLLHGTRNHPDLHNPATFRVNYPKDSEFVVVVTGVSGHGGANLKILVDGIQVLAKDFADRDEDDTRTITTYNGKYSVSVTRGPHEITVVNDGNDWLYVGYRLPDYWFRTNPGLKVYGLCTDLPEPGQVAGFLWIKSERYTWYNHNQGEEFSPVVPARLTLADMPEGKYRVEWWDTYTGQMTPGPTLTSTHGQLTLLLPEITKDIACKLMFAE
jgi:hypothetical protein